MHWGCRLYRQQDCRAGLGIRVIWASGPSYLQTVNLFNKSRPPLPYPSRLETTRTPRKQMLFDVKCCIPSKILTNEADLPPREPVRKSTAGQKEHLVFQEKRTIHLPGCSCPQTVLRHASFCAELPSFPFAPSCAGEGKQIWNAGQQM